MKNRAKRPECRDCYNHKKALARQEKQTKAKGGVQGLVIFDTKTNTVTVYDVVLVSSRTSMRNRNPQLVADIYKQAGYRFIETK
ncbi:MAG: hypothetical protein SF029_25995 [bacterium]|nr:hypothetical protein [bacterium]